MSRTSYSVACLARHGVGPEVMAAASRALEAASRLHGFFLDEQHVPFGADALMRFGHPFPLSSRRAVLEADAVLVASEGGDALGALEDELDLRASVVRVRFEETDELTMFSPLRDDAWSWTLERAFSLACESRGRITLVGVDSRWSEQAAAVVDRYDVLEVEPLAVRAALRDLVFTPHRFDVVVCPPELASTASEVAACMARGRTAAWGRLAFEGPSVFGAEHGTDEELAGQGVADPRSMVLAAALMLGEGLGERSAAVTMAAAVGRARRARTGTVGDVLVAELPSALANVEFHREAVR